MTSQDNFNLPHPPRVLVITATADLALLVCGQVVRFGWTPDYKRVERLEDIRTAFLRGSWDVRIGCWHDTRLASEAAKVVMESGANDLSRLSVVNYGATGVLFAVTSQSGERAREGRLLVDAIDSVFRDVQSPLPGRPEDSQRVPAAKPAAYPDAARVGHNLNDLLSVIYGCAEVLEQKLSTDRAAWQYMERLMTAAQRAAELTAELLAMARKTGPVGVDVESTLIGIRQILQAVAGPGLTIALSFTPDSHFINIGRRELETLCIEIVSRMRHDAAATQGTLQILAGISGSCSPDTSLHPGPGTSISFQMTRDPFQGPAPDAASADVILSREEADEHGLSVVYGILKMSGGSLAIRSWTNGLAITIVLPLVDTPAPRAIAEASRTRAGQFEEGVLEAAARIVSACVHGKPWSADDEMGVRRERHDLVSPIEALALGVLYAELCGGSPSQL